MVHCLAHLTWLLPEPQECLLRDRLECVGLPRVSQEVQDEPRLAAEPDALELQAVVSKWGRLRKRRSRKSRNRAKSRSGRRARAS